VLWRRKSPGGIYTVDFNQDGATIAAAGDGDVRLLNAADGKLQEIHAGRVKPTVAAN
jgi:hypothetical protein